MGGGWHECTLDSPLCRPEGVAPWRHDRRTRVPPHEILAHGMLRDRGFAQTRILRRFAPQNDTRVSPCRLT